MWGGHSGMSNRFRKPWKKGAVLNNETVRSLQYLYEEVMSDACDRRLIILSLSEFICRQKFRYPRPQSHFEKRVNETIHPIVDQWEILKNKGSLKIIDKLTADLLGIVGPRHFFIIAVSFIASMINDDASHSTSIYDFSFVISIKYLLAILESDYYFFGSESPSFELSISQIADGIIACCSYARACSHPTYADIANKQISLREIPDSLHNAVKKLCLEGKDDILRGVVSIGIDDRIEEVIRLLKTDDKDVKHTAVILHGVAGIGKTTLATEVINALKQSDFGFSYASVSLDSQRHDFETQAIELQSRIISQLARERAVVDCIGTGQTKLRKVLSSGHCFIFVDNVVEGRQLHGVFPQDLPNNQRLRILVTSRDPDVSKEIPVDNHYREVYPVDSLPYSPSFLLLKKSVGIKDDGDEKLKKKSVGIRDEKLKKKSVGIKDGGDEKLKKSVGIKDGGDEKFVGELQKIEEVAKLCQGVPLLLILVGKDLKFCRVKDYYDSTLKTLSRWESRNIFDHLLSIFKLLDERVQIAFLDICMFFTGEKWGRVCDIVGKREIDALSERCFIKRDVDNRVYVHDVMEDIAVKLAKKMKNRFIVNIPKSEIDIRDEDLSDLLGKDVKDTQIEGLFIRGEDSQTMNLRPGNLPSLRLFEASGITVEFKDDESCTTFRELQYFSLSQPKHKGVFEFLFKHRDPLLPIEVLSLHGMEDLHELPRGLWRMDKLTVLEITSCRNLESLPADLIHLRCLKQLNLQYSKMLNTLPDTLGNLKWLEELILTGCSSLQALPDSTCQLDRLKKLNMAGCESISSLPNAIGGLELEELILIGCSRLQALPDCKSWCLKKLDMAGCASISSLPDAVGQLGSLEIIDLSSCSNLEGLPSDLSGLVSLKELNLTGCYSLEALPDSICRLKDLKKLEMAGCENISSLPCDVGCLKLEELILTGCSSLQALPYSICRLYSLKKLDMSGCESISTLPNAVGCLDLEELILTGCSSLRELPDSICLLQCLKKLDMAGCASISSLPDAFEKLRSLEIIDLSSCSNLEGLPSDLSGLVSLKELNLKNCRKFKAFPAQLREITSLEKLIFTKSKKATYGGFWKHIVPS